jgi:uncharacterized Zn finger protein (UPF0148 family)
MNPDFLEVACPECKTILIVRKRDGKIVEVRKPILENSTGSRFDDAELKVKGEKDRIAKKFEEAREREKNKMDRLNALFSEGMKRAKEEGPITKPPSPLDLD